MCEIASAENVIPSAMPMFKVVVFSESVDLLREI